MCRYFTNVKLVQVTKWKYEVVFKQPLRENCTAECIIQLNSTYRHGRGGHRGGCCGGRVVPGGVAVPQTAGGCPPRVGEDEGGLDQVVVRLDGVSGRLDQLYTSFPR